MQLYTLTSLHGLDCPSSIGLIIQSQKNSTLMLYIGRYVISLVVNDGPLEGRIVGDRDRCSFYPYARYRQVSLVMNAGP